MSPNENAPRSKNSTIIFLFVFIALIVAILSSLPGVQKLVQPLFKSPSRSVLAKITASFPAEDLKFLILKVQASAGLQIEVYEFNSVTGTQIFKQKFDLPLDSDAYVTIDKNSANLVLSDIDHDGNLDILAPSVDRNGNLRLNTFRFNSDLKMFEPYAEQLTN